MIRVAVFVDPQDVTVRPGVSAVERYIDRHVTEQQNTISVGVLSQRVPLAEEQVLHDLDGPDACAFLRFEFREGVRIAMHILGLPFRPGPLAVAGLEDAEQRVVVQP